MEALYKYRNYLDEIFDSFNQLIKKEILFPKSLGC